MPKISDPRYARFLKEGLIDLVTLEELERGLNKIKSRSDHDRRMWRSFCILLYYAGPRPIELLSLYRKDVGLGKSSMTLLLPASKRGLVRPVQLYYSRPFVLELKAYIEKQHSSFLLFARARSQAVFTSRGGEKVHSTARITENVKNWFGFSPYFFRHSRMSALSEAGADRDEIRLFKGSKSEKSVTPYVHLSPKRSKKIARMLK